MKNHIVVKKKTLIGLFLATIFAIFSSIQILGVGPDRIQYESYFNKITFSDFDSRYEFGFEYFTILFKTIFGSSSFLFFIFTIAFLSLVIKFNYLLKRKDWPILIFLYLISAMILHEFIQIRVGLAIAFCILSLAEACKDKPSFVLKTFFFFFAASFHSTSFFFAPFIFMNTIFKQYNRFYVLTYVFTVFCIGFFSKGPIYSLTGGLVESYVILMEQDETQITVFSARNIALFFIMFIGFIRIKDIEKTMLPFYYVSLAGYASWFGFIWFPLIAHRILELTLLSTITWLPDIKKDFRVIAYIVLIIFGFYYSYNLLDKFV
jgi:hypothetical protein